MHRGRGKFPLASACVLSIAALAADPSQAETTSPDAGRRLYAVNQAARDRGSVSVYDIDSRHRLIRTIRTVPGVHDVRGIVASAVTGRLYVAYSDASRAGRMYSLDLDDDSIVWDRAVSPGVDRLAIDPDGGLLYVPTGEEGSADHINVVDAATGEVVHRVHFSSRSHDAQYPRSGPIFQETKAEDGSGNYLYLIDPRSYAVSRVGPYSGILGPYAVDSASEYVVNNVKNLWGMQVANLKTGEIATAAIPGPAPPGFGLLHGIGWTPDQNEVWQSSSWDDPHVYIWDMRNPMTPVLEDMLTLRSGRGSHWLTFTIKGDYGYISPNKQSDDATEIFDAHSHAAAGTLGSSEDMIEVDFANGKITQVGDQFGIGRR
jgi:DNA-binding beta-propeller fold protein YncE